MAVASLTSACATTRAVPRPFPGATIVTRPAAPDAPTVAPDGTMVRTPNAPDAPIAPDAPSAPAAPNLASRRFDGRAIAQFAMGFRGVPYRLGGSDPGGFLWGGFGVGILRHGALNDAGERLERAIAIQRLVVFFSDAFAGRTVAADAIRAINFGPGAIDRGNRKDEGAKEAECEPGGSRRALHIRR